MVLTHHPAETTRKQGGIFYFFYKSKFHCLGGGGNEFLTIDKLELILKHSNPSDINTQKSIQHFLPCTGDDFASYLTEKTEAIRRGNTQVPAIQAHSHLHPVSLCVLPPPIPGILDWIKSLYYKKTKHYLDARYYSFQPTQGHSSINSFLSPASSVFSFLHKHSPQYSNDFCIPFPVTHSLLQLLFPFSASQIIIVVEYYIALTVCQTQLVRALCTLGFKIHLVPQ